MKFQDSHRPLSTTLREVVDDIRGDRITLRALMESIGEQGLLLLCAVLSLPFLIPVSIPGVSTVFGLGIILLGVAVTLNRLPWLPRKILDREIETARLRPALEKGIGIVARIDRHVRPRLGVLTRNAVMDRVNGFMLVFCGLLLMAPFGFVPFSNTLPAVAILLLCFGMIQRDGLFILLGYVMTAATLIYFGVLAYGVYRAGGAILN